MVFGQTGRVLDPLAYYKSYGEIEIITIQISAYCREVSALTIKIIWSMINRQFFQCRIFAMKNVRNLKYFWGSSQNYFVF